MLELMVGMYIGMTILENWLVASNDMKHSTPG